MKNESNDFDLQGVADAALKGQNTNPQPQPTVNHDRYANDPLMASVDDDAAANVGDTQVFVEPPKPAAVNPDVAKLMNTPSPHAPAPAPVPTSIGLEADSLDTVLPPNMPKVQSQAPTTNVVQFNADGSFSAAQKDLINSNTTYIPEEKWDEIIRPIFEAAEENCDQLIMQFGFSRADAQNGAYNDVVKRIADADAEFHKKNPDVGTIIVDKTNVNKLGLTADEHAKLEHVKRIKLIKVEDRDLSNIEIENIDEHHIAEHIRNIEGSMAKYSVPLPLLGDFMTFKGAQIVQFLNIMRFEDSKDDELLNTKASLIYDKIQSSAVLNRYKEDGSSGMSFAEFINNFPFADVDMALYGILCASSMEETSANLECACGHTWEAQYKISNLLKSDGMNDDFKARTEDILSHKVDVEYLRNLRAKKRMSHRFKSPYTNNIYDLSYPTIGRVLDLYRIIDINDPVSGYYMAISMYLSQVYIYNPKTGKYIPPIDANKTQLMFDTVKTLTDEDLNLIVSESGDEFTYVPYFILECECPSCHRRVRHNLDIDSMIFLKARDSKVEIDK